ncbi:hypothetical protein BJ742DRAFT_792726, partial [Cladochytrium replicatum]
MFGLVCSNPDAIDLIHHNVNICVIQLLSELFHAHALGSHTLLHVIHSNNVLPKLLKSVVPSEDIVINEQSSTVLSFIVDIMRESHGTDFELLSIFELYQGYKVFLDWLTKYTLSNEEYKEKGMILIRELLYIGDYIYTPTQSSEASSPFQHNDFRAPIPNSAPSICNIQALKLIIEFCTQPATPLETTSQCEVLQMLLDEFSENKVNYFISEQVKFFIQLVENIEQCADQTRVKILELLEFALTEMNYFPLKEITILCSYLQRGSESVIVLICSFLVKWMKKSKKYIDIFRDLGLINELDSIISLNLEILGSKDTFKVDSAGPKKMNSIEFSSLMHLLAHMIEYHENANLFRRANKGQLFEFLKYGNFRPGALSVISELVKESVMSASADLPEFVRLIEFLHASGQSDIEMMIEIMDMISKLLELFPIAARNAFRESSGFIAAVSVILSMRFSQSESQQSQKKQLRFLKSWFQLILTSLKGHGENRKVFSEQIKQGTLEDALIITGILNHPHCLMTFGGLFALALEDNALIQHFDVYENEYIEWSLENSSHLMSIVEQELVRLIQNTNCILQNSDVIYLIMKLLPSTAKSMDVIPLFILNAALVILLGNIHNQIKMNNSGVNHLLLSWAFHDTPCWFLGTDSTGSEQNIHHQKAEVLLKSLIKKLSENGINKQDLKYLLTFSSNQVMDKLIDSAHMLHPFATDLILHALQYCRYPSYLHFDLTSNNHCCLVLDDFGRPFPPQTGYSFMCWIRLNNFDSHYSTPLLTVMDFDKHMRLLISLECSPKNCINVQTFKGACTFESVSLNIDQWYHLAFVHQKPRLTASYIDFYINGKLVQHVKLGYLGHPGSSSKVRTCIGWSAEPSQPSVAKAQWDLGPTYFIEEILLDAASISAIFNVGLEYCANFQGDLSKYKTLSMQQQTSGTIKRGITLSSAITTILGQSRREANIELTIPEEKILFSISCENSLEALLLSHRNERFSIIAQKVMKLPGVRGILNSAKARLNSDPSVLHNIIQFQGSVLVVTPERVSDGIWILGGCPLLLKITEKSETPDSLHKCLLVLVEAIRYSWRNTEEMDNEQLYTVLAKIITDKKEMLDSPHMDAIGELVGRLPDSPGDSFVLNRTAFASIYLDVELWKGDSHLQSIYLEHLEDFTISNIMAKSINISELNQLGIVKRLLLYLRLKIFSEKFLPRIVNILCVCFCESFTPENIGHVCASLLTTLTEHESQIRGFDNTSYSVLLRNSLLAMLGQIFAGEKGQVLTIKFTNVVKSRWIIPFFSNNVHESTVIHATNTLCVIMKQLGPAFKFKEGFCTLRNYFKYHFRISAIYPILLSLLSDSSTDNSDKIASISTCVLSSRGRHFSKETVVLILYMIHGAIFNIDKTTKPKEEIDKDIINSNIQLTFKVFERLLSNNEFKEILCTEDVIDKLMAIVFEVFEKLKTEYVCNHDHQAPPETEFVSPINLESLSKSSVLTPTDIAVSLSFEHLPSITCNFGFSATPIKCILEFVIKFCLDSILGQWKNFMAFELITKAAVPQITSKDKLIQLNCFILLEIVNGLEQELNQNRSLFEDPFKMGSIAKLCSLLVDSIYQGTFPGGRRVTFNLLVALIEMFEPVVARHGKRDILWNFLKSLNRLVLYKLGQHAQAQEGKDKSLLKFLDLIMFNQKVIFSSYNNDADFFKALAYHMFVYLFSSNERVKKKTVMIWKLLLLQKPLYVSQILKSENGLDFSSEFLMLLDSNIEKFDTWAAKVKNDLNNLFQENTMRVWDSLLNNELKQARENLRNWHIKHAIRLKHYYVKKRREEEIILKLGVQIASWVQSVQTHEEERLRSFAQQLSIHNELFLSNWGRITERLFQERGLWGTKATDGSIKIELDLFEGPSRMRKRFVWRTETFSKYKSKAEKVAASNMALGSLKHASEVLVTGDIEQCQEPIENTDVLGNLNYPDSPILIEKDEKDDDLYNDEENQEAENYERDWINICDWDNNTQISKYLEKEDNIVDVYNCFCIYGLDIRGSVSILCQKQFYVINDIIRSEKGDFVDIDSTTMEERDELYSKLNIIPDKYDTNSVPKYYCHKMAFTDVDEVHKRMYGLRQIAIEVFGIDGRSLLISFLDPIIRDTVYNKLVPKSRISSTLEAVTKFTTNVDNAALLSKFQTQWMQNEISNFDYLMKLNTLAGRTYNDLNQYPVFPWILREYESEKLDLSNATVFRDLSKPMGAQGADRREKFSERYKLWDDQSLPPCHYGTHYSSAMIVCTWLMRLEPFTRYYVQLQGGHFDHPDRLFSSLGKSWLSASEQSTSDVRELIPEFFYLPESLLNINQHVFGTKQNGEIINDVILPPWAKGSAKLFIQKHREALESEYVSMHLHEWIDLIFGYKQQGEEAVKAMNVFHHLSYEGSVNIDNIEDEVEKQATIAIINNFGQTPKQLFKKPHPCRTVKSATIKEYSLLIQSALPLRVLHNQPIGDCQIVDEKLVALGPSRRFQSPACQRFIEWDYLDKSMRLWNAETGKILALYENMHIGHVTCCCFADETTLITGGSDMTVCIWKIAGKKADINLKCCLRGHGSKVISLDICSSYGVVVSGEEGGSAIIWDLSSFRYLKSLYNLGGPVSLITTNKKTGDILTCTDQTIYLWTINGDLLAKKTVGSSIHDPITACAIIE